MNKLKRLFSSSFSEKSETEKSDGEKSDSDKKSLASDDILYYSPLSASYTEGSSPSVTSSNLRCSTPLKSARDSIIPPVYPKAMTGFPGTWRLAIDKHGEKLYTTNNHGSGAYSIMSLQTPGKDQLIKTVQCQYIWNIRGIAVDESENVYLTGDHKVQKYDAEGKLVASFGWTEPGSAWYQCDDPNGLCCYMEHVYVCDSRNRRIQVLSSDLEHLGCIDNGAHLSHPEDIEFDTKGQMHVLDSGNQSVVVFDSEGNHMYNIKFPENEMLFPVSMRMIGGHYYVSDLSKLHIAVFSTTGELLHKIQVVSREEPTEDVDGFVHIETSTMQRPVGLAVDYHGYIYVSNIDSKEVQIF